MTAFADCIELHSAFLNFVLEQFLLHITIVRPMNAAAINRYCRDLDYICKELKVEIRTTNLLNSFIKRFNCSYSKMLNVSEQVKNFLLLLPELASNDSRKVDQFAAILPEWFIIQALICSSGDQFLLPHQSSV